jgi:hypothetical protein
VWRGSSDSPPTPSERTLHDLLKAELRRRIAVFATTSTLRDQFDEETANSIFLLGEYLTLINRHSLQQQVARLATPVQAAPAAAPAPVAVPADSSKAASDTTHP